MSLWSGLLIFDTDACLAYLSVEETVQQGDHKTLATAKPKPSSATLPNMGITYRLRRIRHQQERPEPSVGNLLFGRERINVLWNNKYHYLKRV